MATKKKAKLSPKVFVALDQALGIAQNARDKALDALIDAKHVVEAAEARHWQAAKIVEALEFALE